MFERINLQYVSKNKQTRSGCVCRIYMYISCVDSRSVIIKCYLCSKYAKLLQGSLQLMVNSHLRVKLSMIKMLFVQHEADKKEI